MSETTQQDGIGWVRADAIYPTDIGHLTWQGGRWVPSSVEVAYGQALAALREDRERLEWLMLAAVEFSQEHKWTRDEIDAAMEETR